MGRQQWNAVRDALPRNDKYQNPARLKPAIGMLQEDRLHAAILPFAYLEVVGWIELEQ